MSTPPLAQVPYSAISRVARIRLEARRIAAMVAQLPDEVLDQSNSNVVRQAALDSFYLNARLLIEFLEVCPQRSDRSVSNTLAKGTIWPTPFLTAARRRKLREYYKDTSKHVIHFSTRRTELVPVSSWKLRAVARTVLALWDEFAMVSSHPLVPRTSHLSHLDL
ncbi:hypothetical protein [Mycobacterium colombiense]|uniref:hypothetical protein n=1 Tax=Mycobacterium colombiense TaxID=339268 RepID=UPI0012DB4DFC|nr:hypothetical protein [Mycobacterium colombiense]